MLVGTVGRGPSERLLAYEYTTSNAQIKIDFKMSDKSNLNPGNLVPSGNRELATDKSGLVKRGLDLVQERGLGETKIRVLIGNLDNNITETISGFIKHAIGEKYHVIVTSTAYCDELLNLTESQAFDIFVLIINNIIFPSDNLPPEKPIEKSLQLITHLRTEYKRPIIALTGLSDDPLFSDKVKLAGADFFFRMPFSPKAFQAAITQVLAI